MKKFTVAAMPLLVGAMLWAQTTTTSKPANGGVVLPKGTRVMSTSLRVSPTAGKALYVSQKVEFIPGQEQPNVSFACMGVYLKAGAQADLTKGMNEPGQNRVIIPGDISPDGMWTRIVVGKDGKFSSYLQNLKTLKPIKLGADAPLPAAWIGTKLAVTRGDLMKGYFDKIQLVDTSGKKVTLPVCGTVAGGGKNFLLAVVDPKNPSATLQMNTREEQGMLSVLDTNGKVLRTLEPAASVSSQPIVSPSGKYVTFQSKPVGAPEGPGTKYAVRVLSLDGKDKRTIEGTGMPLAVLDDGSVVAPGVLQELDGSMLKLYGRSGKSKELVKAVDATFAGGKLWYVVADGDRQVLKSMKLPTGK